MILVLSLLTSALMLFCAYLFIQWQKYKELFEISDVQNKSLGEELSHIQKIMKDVVYARVDD